MVIYYFTFQCCHYTVKYLFQLHTIFIQMFQSNNTQYVLNTYTVPYTSNVLKEFYKISVHFLLTLFLRLCPILSVIFSCTQSIHFFLLPGLPPLPSSLLFCHCFQCSTFYNSCAVTVSYRSSSFYCFHKHILHFQYVSVLFLILSLSATHD